MRTTIFMSVGSSTTGLLLSTVLMMNERQPVTLSTVVSWERGLHIVLAPPFESCVRLLGSGRLRDDVLFYLLRGRPASFTYL
jgi:hypothetical protein